MPSYSTYHSSFDFSQWFDATFELLKESERTILRIWLDENECTNPLSIMALEDNAAILPTSWKLGTKLALRQAAKSMNSGKIDALCVIVFL
jgi:hypothetical protein